MTDNAELPVEVNPTPNAPMAPQAPKAEDFKKEYEALCEKMGFKVVVTPAYIARDDNTFSMVLQYSIGALPKPNK